MDFSIWVRLWVGGAVLALVQLLAAVPWIMALTSDVAVSRWRQLVGLLVRMLVFGVIGGAIIAAASLFEQDQDFLATVGRLYGAALYFQLIFDFFVILFAVLLVIWPRGAAVAVAAFREGVRQPLYWLLLCVATVLLLVMPFLPYFTFGEDLKMIKQIGNDLIMLVSGLFGVLVASISISEEIEGRTAITLMSKPVSRRQFLLGKFLGILMASLSMAAMLSLVYLFVMWYKPYYDKDPLPPPFLIPNSPAALPIGVQWWFYDLILASPGLVLGFCQDMVLISIAVALATRLPMVVNLVVNLVIFFLGNLTSVLTRVPQVRYPLVRFMAQLFDYLLPGLDLFNVGPALARDQIPSFWDLAQYVGLATGYAVLYTAIALLFGLILFEDRDLA